MNLFKQYFIIICLWLKANTNYRTVCQFVVIRLRSSKDIKDYKVPHNNIRFINFLGTLIFMCHQSTFAIFHSSQAPNIVIYQPISSKTFQYQASYVFRCFQFKFFKFKFLRFSQLNIQILRQSWPSKNTNVQKISFSLHQVNVREVGTTIVAYLFQTLLTIIFRTS